MISTVVLVLGTEVSVTSDSDVGQATCVRICNTTGSDAVVTLKNVGAVTLGTFTVIGKTTEYIRKMPTDTIGCSGACKCTKVGF